MSRLENDGDDRFDLGGPCGSRTMTVQAEPYPPYKPTQVTSTPKQPTREISLTAEDMRGFSIQGPYGMNLSLSTAMPGNFSFSLPSDRRAASEPASSETNLNPVLARSHNDYSENYAFSLSADDTAIRAPSPAPTEIEDPEPETILEDLQRLGIKVRDYAFRAPLPSRPSGAAEIFDQHKGIAEFEHRLSQTPRTYPIQGKTLRRLLDLRWVSMDEAKARLHQMDWESMKDYDAKSSDYPWRPCKWTDIPDSDHRQALLLEWGGYFFGMDRIRRQMEFMEDREKRERLLVEEAQERLRIMEEERQGGMGMVIDPLLDDEPISPTCSSKKRALEHSASTPSFSCNNVSAGPKRVRLGDAQNAIASSQPLPAIPPPLPPKQYPAPLSSYNPALYPEAAKIIEAEARPPPPPRTDTPPLEEGDNDDEMTGGGHPLQRKKKGLKRTLSRTQTFKQL